MAGVSTDEEVLEDLGLNADLYMFNQDGAQDEAFDFFSVALTLRSTR